MNHLHVVWTNSERDDDDDCAYCWQCWMEGQPLSRHSTDTMLADLKQKMLGPAGTTSSLLINGNGTPAM